MLKSQENFENVSNKQDFINLLRRAVELECNSNKELLWETFLEIFIEENTVEERISAISEVIDMLKNISWKTANEDLFNEIDILLLELDDIDDTKNEERVKDSIFINNSLDLLNTEGLSKLLQKLRILIWVIAIKPIEWGEIFNSLTSKNWWLNSAVWVIWGNNIVYDDTKKEVNLLDKEWKIVLSIETIDIPFWDLADEMNNWKEKTITFLQDRLEEITRKPTVEQTEEILEYEKNSLINIVKDHILNTRFSDEKFEEIITNVTNVFLKNKDWVDQYLFLENDVIFELSDIWLLDESLFLTYEDDYRKILENPHYKEYIKYKNGKWGTDFTQDMQYIEDNFDKVNQRVLNHIQRVIKYLKLNKVPDLDFIWDGLLVDDSVLYEYNIYDKGTYVNEESGNLELYPYEDEEDWGAVMNLEDTPIATISMGDIMDEEFQLKLSERNSKIISMLQEEIDRLQDKLTVDEADGILQGK